MQIALSGVARMSLRPVLAGGNHDLVEGKIIQMLLGSKDKDLLGFSLEKLSTYGMLGHLSKDYLNHLFKELERVGLLLR